MTRRARSRTRTRRYNIARHVLLFPARFVVAVCTAVLTPYLKSMEPRNARPKDR